MYEFSPVGQPDPVDAVIRSAGGVLIDLSRSSWITPRLLALIPVIVQSSGDEPVHFSAPTGKFASYASRMALGTVLDELGVTHDLPPVRRNDRSGTLIELQSFSASDYAGPEALTQLMQERCDTAGIPPEVGDAIAGQIYELCNNVVAHARCERGWLCAQTYQQRGRHRLELVVADPGRGIRAALAGTEFEQLTDEQSIRTAVMSRTSGVGRPNHGGVGLNRLLGYVEHMSGTVRIRSGDSQVSFQPGGTGDRTATLELQGTTIGCSIWF